ncbi:MAG TPA: 1-(5-phosphoribosyl)-5-[(5-phosphoribosylamino)methylideneamino]imidazole-4-carboxamide isomerase [Candidatus Thermoplasmatota archaeon]
MNLYPAIDLLEKKVVTLVQGVRGTQTTEHKDPLDVYARWVREGAEWVHVIDLDAAFGKGDHRLMIEDFLDAKRAKLQIGGGIRTTEQVARLLSRGAERVIVGTRGIEEPSWLAEITQQHPDQIVLAVDAKNGKIVTRGWAKNTGQDVIEVMRKMSRLPLAGFLFTSVNVEGKMQGLDHDSIVQVFHATELPVIASGGVTDYDDLKFLKGLGVEGAVLGAALYQGRIDFQVAKNLVEGV